MPLLEQIRRHPLRVVKSLALYSSFVCIGMSLGIVGPTMLDLQLEVSTTIDKITYVLPGRAGGYAAGSFLGMS